LTLLWYMLAVLCTMLIPNVTSAASTNIASEDCLPIDEAHKDQIIDQIASVGSEAVVSLLCKRQRCDVSFELSGKEIYSTRPFPAPGRFCIRAWEVPATGTADCQQRITGISFEFWPPKAPEPDSIEINAGPTGFDAKTCLGDELPQLEGDRLPVIHVYFAKSARITVFDYRD
jgi:hypothetical protein